MVARGLMPGRVPGVLQLTTGTGRALIASSVAVPGMLTGAHGRRTVSLWQVLLVTMQLRGAGPRLACLCRLKLSAPMPS